MSAASAEFFFSFPKALFVARHTPAPRRGIPPTLTREIKRKVEQQSALASAQNANTEQMFTGMLTLFGPYL